MLYAAEGAKKEPYKISLANTDPKIIKFFSKWISDFLDIPKEKLRFELHLYENMDIKKEKKFTRFADRNTKISWSKNTMV